MIIRKIKLRYKLQHAICEQPGTNVCSDNISVRSSEAIIPEQKSFYPSLIRGMNRRDYPQNSTSDFETINQRIRNPGATGEIINSRKFSRRRRYLSRKAQRGFLQSAKQHTGPVPCSWPSRHLLNSNALHLNAPRPSPAAAALGHLDSLHARRN